MPYVCLAILLSLLPGAAFAASLNGEIICDQCNNFQGLYVELSGSSGNTASPVRAAVASDGRFQVRGVNFGEYNVTVFDRDGSELSRDFVKVTDSGSSVAVRVTPPAQALVPHGESSTVSIKRLQHKPPKEARKAFTKAAQKSERGDSAAAIALLEKAIEIDPEYVEALNNLGARHMVLGQFQQAVPYFERAVALDPHSSKPFSNLSLAYLNTGDPKAAETAARKALQNNPTERPARYLLGMSLFLQKKITAETLQSLRQAQESFPRAQIALAMAEASAGETAHAKATLKRYLGTNQEYMRSEAKQMLAKLDAQQESASIK